MILVKKGLPVLIGILTLVSGPGTVSEAANKKASGKEIPAVETKIKQVPGLRGEKTPQWKVLWEKAREGILQKKYPEAIQDYRKALSLKPNLDEARQELAQVLLNLERWGEALTELEILADHQPLDLKVQKGLADLLSQKKEYRRANEIYLKILQKDPDNLGVRLTLASNYYQINESEKALMEWRQVHIRDPQNVEARTHLADVLGGTKRLDESILLLEGLVKQFPKQTSFKKKLALALVASHRNKEALPYLLELNRQDPSDLDIQLPLAQVLSSGKNYSQSLRHLDAYLKKKPDNQNALWEKARVLFHTGHFLEALEVYGKLVKADPENLDLHREMAEAYLASGKIPEALVELEYLVQHVPDDIALYEKIGGIYFQNKKYSQAVSAYQKILSAEPANSQAQLSLARAYNFSGAKEKALPIYRVLTAKGSDQNLQSEMADLLMDIQQFPEAFLIYRQILSQNPENWEVRLKLATGLYRQKEFHLAGGELEILVRQQPGQSAIWALAGHNALERGEYQQAQKAFLKVLTLGDDRSAVLIRLGEAWRLLGRPWKGISYLDWALTIKPADQEITVEKALALIEGGGLASARLILEPLIQTNHHDFKVQRAWVRLLAALDRSEEAEAGWEQLEKQFPLEVEWIYQDLAEFYSRRGKPDLALTYLQKAHVKDPNNLDIRRKIGRSLLALGQWKDAESYYLNLETEQLLLDEVRWGLAVIAIRQGRFGVARENLSRALQETPDSVRVRFWLVWLSDRDRIWTDEAKNVKRTLFDVSRNQDGGLLELADSYREVNDLKKARDIYRDLMEKGDDDEVLLALNRMMEVWQAEKNTAELQETLVNMQKRFPRNQRLSRRLIELYSHQREYALAVKMIDGLLKIEDPRDPVLHLKKARLLERWNKHSDSQKVFQKLLDPSVDQLFRRKVSEFISLQDPLVASLFKEPIAPRGIGSFNPLFERTDERLMVSPLEPKLNEKFRLTIERLKPMALIQKKVFLEKEGKDYLWRNEGRQARPLLLELKRIDPDNEEIQYDLGRSFLTQN